MKFLALASLVLPVVFAQATTSLPGAKETGDLGDAKRIINNPSNVTYEAVFNQANGVKGKFVFKAGKNGEGVAVSVNLEGFNQNGVFGPYKYHIHDQPVPANGSCAGTLAHLDPYVRGQANPCNIEKPETCEVDDLSGKHLSANGFNSSTYANAYTDHFLSLVHPSGAFIGNRSITIHGFGNATRIACVNITLGAAPFSSGGNSTVKPNPPKGDEDDDSSDNGGKGADIGGKGAGKDDADSAAGVVKTGVFGLGLAVAAVVGLVL